MTTAPHRRWSKFVGACALAAGLEAGGCDAPVVYPCGADADCENQAGAQGHCERSVGFCSFPDPACPSGERYSEHASSAVAGTCSRAPLPDAMATVTSDPSGADSGAASTTSGADPDPGPSQTSDETGTWGADPVDPPPCTEQEEDLDAELAECTDPQSNDPALCESTAGPGRMLLDLAASSLQGQPVTVFLIFEVPEELPPLSGAELRLTVSADSSSESSGELWAVAPFTLESLGTTQPNKVGDAPLVEDPGPVAGGDRRIYALDPATVPSGPLHLGLFPVSNDGLRLENLDNVPPNRPRLRIRYCE